ncbi:cytochrome P450 [Pseudonocardia xishanensis]|uniref:Monooxygenase YjiB n=1 Tax=Pseudonocardia xishanensis TaxID=630995 RepID=A0ABP8S468_9PSEU
MSDSAARGTRLLSEVLSSQDPYPIYEELRELDEGVHWSEEFQGWFPSRAADLRRIGENSKVYSGDLSDPKGTLNRYDPSDPRQNDYGEISSRFLFFLEPPEHTVVRSALRHAFTPRAMLGWRTVVERIVDGLLAEFSHGDETDFVETLSTKIPIEVICTILGVPSEDFPMFVAMTDAVMLTLDPAIQGEKRVEVLYRAAEMVDYMNELADLRQKDPKDDLISQIVNTPVQDGKPLDRKTAVSQAVILLVAGNDTTNSLLGNTMGILLDRPELQRRVAEDLSLVSPLIEESLRYAPPFQFETRKATQDHILGGREIKAGDAFFPLIAAANRDPREFDNPLEFDIDRENKRHLSFSHGIHFCVGAPLARMEGIVGMTKVLERFPHICDGSAPRRPRVDNINARGWKNLPVALHE